MRFLDGMRALEAMGVTTWVEIGPHPVLNALGTRCVQEPKAARWIASLRRNGDDARVALEGLGAVFAGGRAVEVPGRGQLVDLPPYPFQRQRHWIEGQAAVAAPRASEAKAEAVLETRWVPAPPARTVPEGERVVVEAGELGALLETLQGLTSARGRVMVVTRDAWSEQPDPDAAAAWGLVRSWRSARPPGRTVLVDVAPGDDVAAAVQLAATTDEDEVMVREGAALAPRLVPVQRVDPALSDETAPRLSSTSSPDPALPDGTAPRLSSTPSPDPALPDGTAPRPVPRALDGKTVLSEGPWLITGGLGALGLEIARWLVASGARHLVLVGRRPPSDAARAALAALDARVETLQADVADLDAMRAALGDREIRGVFHAAGVLAGSAIGALTGDALSAVLRPKVDGAKVLEALCPKAEAFVLFSSIASVIGSPDGAYAAANAWLDAFARRRRARGLPAVSIAWGPFEGGGMTAALDPTHRTRLARLGFGLLPPARALGRMGTLLAGPPNAAVVTLDPQRLAAALPRPSSALRSLVQGADRAGPRPPQPARAAPKGEALRGHVRAAVAEVFGRRPDEVPLDRPLAELGLDSLLAMDIRDRLAVLVGRPLPAPLVFDHPTVVALARFLEDPDPVVTDAPRAAPDEPVAVIGIGCRFPGGATGAESFWRMLLEGVDAVSEIPASRWDVEAWFDPDPDAPGRTYARHGAFLPGIEHFDARFFGVSPREARQMDPQQRVLLEVTWEALESAGIAPDSLAGSRTGVFVGICSDGYQEHTAVGEIDPYTGTGNAKSVAAGRVSYALDLHGPSVAIDTACSSSLVAVHQACMALRGGECGLALASGVNLVMSPEATVSLSKLRVLSPTGHCRTFGDGADGYVRAEGCGVVVLKRLADARRDGDPVLAVIRGSAVNHDGRSQGLAAPSGPAQQRVVKAALAQAGLEPAAVGYVECHGTGTALGDPIEVEALAASLGGRRDQPLVIGSVKSNIGHAEGAAGVAGLIKAVLAVRNGLVPATLHADPPNSRVPWKDLPLRIAHQAMPWTAGVPRVAGVSSFGFGGTNAHAVVQEAPPAVAAVPEAARPAHLLLLSARSEAALGEQCRRLLAHLETHPDLVLGDVAHTLAVGRTHFPWRLALPACDREEAITALRSAIAGTLPQGAWRGEAPEQPPAIVARVQDPGAARSVDAAAERPAPASTDLAQAPRAPDAASLARLHAWGLPISGEGEVMEVPLSDERATLELLGRLHVRGVRLDWEEIDRPFGFSRVPLPTYPFERARHWAERADDAPPTGAGQLSSHPMLGTAFSPASHKGERVWEQATDAPGLRFLKDHQVEDAVIVPGAAWLEAAAAAVAELEGATTVELSDVRFERPLALDSPRTYQLSIGADRTWVVSSRSREGAESWTPHARGSGRPASPSERKPVDLEALKARLQPQDVDALYGALDAHDFHYGPVFKAIKALWRAGDEVLARLEAPGADRFLIHPAMLDASFQALAAVVSVEGDKPAVPMGVRRLRVHGRCKAPAWAWVRRRPGEEISADVVITDERGAPCVEVEGLRVAPLERAPADAADQLWFEIAWEPGPAPATDAAVGRWAVLAAPNADVEHGARVARAEVAAAADAGVKREISFGERVARAIESAGGEAVRASTPSEALVAPGTRGVICVASDGPESWEPILQVARGLLGRERSRLAIITRGAVPAGDGPVSPFQASLWGFGRTLALEHPELGCRLVDLDGDTEGLAAALAPEDGEPQVALRGGARFVARLVQRPPGERPRIPAGDRSWRLEIGAVGQLDQLAMVEVDRRPPGPGEVELEVEAAGLNFIDVLTALGALGDSVPRLVAGGDFTGLGAECAGRVTRAGPGVSLVPGQRVLAAASGCLARHVTTSAELVVPIPDSLSAADAATLPIAYATVLYGLHHVAHLEKGERVLIHSATGGVGLAAVAWAKHTGAEIFATAGSEAKRAHLRSLGVERVSDSRSLRFVEDVRAWTNGEGVDVVLNSLAGPLLAAGVDLLRDHGRFIELGK
ncbi:MAG TPA: beta-ketoacyl synthase N-terminal-like domain-containing protein, partial [Myxococcales bacterium]|nr:beta-ketoacyl synthase N-terminal-like domain-containing protein [Myxococcales bacterium]